MRKSGYVTVVTALFVAVLFGILFSEADRTPTPAAPLPTSILGKSPSDFVEMLPGGGKRLKLPVLFEFCGMPMILVEPDGDSIKHYSRDALKKRLKELRGTPILTNDVTKEYGMKCLKDERKTPRIDPERKDKRRTVPEAGPAREWSA